MGRRPKSFELRDKNTRPTKLICGFPLQQAQQHQPAKGTLFAALRGVQVWPNAGPPCPVQLEFLSSSGTARAPDEKGQTTKDIQTTPLSVTPPPPSKPNRGLLPGLWAAQSPRESASSLGRPGGAPVPWLLAPRNAFMALGKWRLNALLQTSSRATTKQVGTRDMIEWNKASNPKQLLRALKTKDYEMFQFGTYRFGGAAHLLTDLVDFPLLILHGFYHYCLFDVPFDGT